MGFIWIETGKPYLYIEYENVQNDKKLYHCNEDYHFGEVDYDLNEIFVVDYVKLYEEKERIRQEKLEYERLKSIYGNKEKEDTEKYIKEQVNYFDKEYEAKLAKINKYSEKKPIYFIEL